MGSALAWLGAGLVLMVAPGAVPIAGPVAASAADSETGHGGWSGFRGPNRDGISPETGLLDAWPEAGPPVLWRTPAGAGFSGIAVGGGRAFTQWQEGDEQLLVALDVGDGRLLWKRRLGPAFVHGYGDGPRSTPVLDGDRVFAIDARGHLAAFRAGDGGPIWSHDLAAEFGARIPSIGYASTPLVEGDLLLVEVGAREAAFMAFDTETGEVAWSSQSDEPAYVSPIPLTHGERRQVVFFSASGLHALAPGDGGLLWRYPLAAPCPATGIPLAAASPVFVPPDRLFVATAWGDESGSALLRLSADEAGATVDRLWHAKLIDGEINTPILVGGHLYGFKGDIFLSVEAATGEMGWSTRGYGRGSLIAADGKLIVLGEGGKLGLVEADPRQYRELASAQVLKGRSWTAPALAGGRLFVRNAAEVVSLDLARSSPS